MPRDVSGTSFYLNHASVLASGVAVVTVILAGFQNVGTCWYVLLLLVRVVVVVARESGY